MMSDQSIVIYVSDLDAYKSLVEKEAVKEIAVALLNAIPDLDVHNAIILELRKQKGVEI